MRRGVLIMAVLWVAGVAPAHAGTVSYSPGSSETGLCSKYGMCRVDPATLTMTAAPGEVNVFSTGPTAPGALTVHDAGAPLSVDPAATNCSNLDANTVRCTVIPSSGSLRTSIVADLGDGNDSVGDTRDRGDAALTVNGGAGNDVLTGSGALNGGAGDDTLTGGNLDGGPGNDVLTGVGGSASLEGGDGNDQITAASTGPFGVTANGGTGDDKISVVGDGAKVSGDNGQDEITATGNNNQLNGGPDNDQITSTTTGASFVTAHGGAGDDKINVAGDGAKLSGDAGQDELIAIGNNSQLDGGGGADHLVGGPQGDTLDGGDGNDHLEGGGGNDKLIGGAGIDHLDGGTGADRILARDHRRDSIDCGDGGTDRALVDAGDRVSRCETVLRPVKHRRR